MALIRYIRMPAQEFNRRMNVSPSFDYIEPEKPTVIFGYHGTTTPNPVLNEGFGTDPVLMRHSLTSSASKVLNRVHLLSTENNPGVYFSDRKEDASTFGTAVPVEVQVERPFVLEQGRLSDLRDLDPDAISEEYDSIIVKGNRLGLAGSLYRQGVVFDPQKITPVTKHRPIIVPTKGAKVRNVETGAVGTLQDDPLYNGYYGKVLASIAWNRGSKGSHQLEKATEEDFGDLEIIGGHRQMVNEAVAAGYDVPVESSHWQEFSNISYRRRGNFHRLAEEWGVPEQPYIYVR